MRNIGWLMGFASIVIILAGLKAASSIIVPFLLALFLAIIVSPVLEILQKFKIPRTIAFVVTTICVFGLISMFGKIIFSTLTAFTGQLPELQNKFRMILDSSIAKINSRGVFDIDPDYFGIDPNIIFTNVRVLIRDMTSFLSMSLFIFLLISFMLFETGSLKKKLAFLDRKNPQAKVFIDTFVFNLKKYLLIKTIASAFTGFFIGVFLYMLEVPYATLWGILAYILNYIPTIGSIVAAVPTLFITMTTGDLSMSLWALGIYLLVNTIIGSIIEPRFLGEGLGISTILVLASLLLWGFIFGIGGMFLAVPLTMTIQIALASNPKTRTIALLLSSDIEKSQKTLMHLEAKHASVDESTSAD